MMDWGPPHMDECAIYKGRKCDCRGSSDGDK